MLVSFFGSLFFGFFISRKQRASSGAVFRSIYTYKTYIYIRKKEWSKKPVFMRVCGFGLGQNFASKWTIFREVLDKISRVFGQNFASSLACFLGALSCAVLCRQILNTLWSYCRRLCLRATKRTIFRVFLYLNFKRSFVHFVRLYIAFALEVVKDPLYRLRCALLLLYCGYICVFIDGR